MKIKEENGMKKLINAITAAGILVSAVPAYQIYAEEPDYSEDSVLVVKEGETETLTFSAEDAVYNVSVPAGSAEYISAEYDADTYTVSVTGISPCDETVLIVMKNPDAEAEEVTVKVKVEAAQTEEAVVAEETPAEEAVVPAEETTTEEVVIAEETEEEKLAAGDDLVNVADGFLNKDGKNYYYKDNVALTGLQTIEEKQYYFGEDGAMLTGYQFITEKNKSYFFNEAEKAEDCYAVTDEWKTVDGKKYYFKPNGQAEVGVKTVGNDLYYLNRPAGDAAVGLQVINGRTYFFDKDGKAFKGGWKDVDGKRYFFKTNGAAEKGWKTINGKWYFMDRTTAVMQKGLQFIDNKSYFFNNDGTAFTGGWKQVSGKWYYFKTNGAAEKGWRQEGSNWYYLNKPKGDMVVGWKQIDGKWYYFRSSGKMAAGGWIQVDGKWYYLNKGGSMKSDCWFKENGNWYYLAKSGAMVTGWLKRPDAWYYFRDNGKMYSNGTITINGKSQRFAPDGQWIDNSWIASQARPFRLYVNRAHCTMTVYLKDYQGNYKIPYKAILISVGLSGTSTPSGWSEIGQKYLWYWYKEDTCWLRYVSFFSNGGKMMHSEAYYTQDLDNMLLGEFNKLGYAASHGCVRMAVIDAKWVYENCYAGTKVYVYDDWSSPGPLGKPSAIRVDDSSGTGWDPTDPDPSNPWNW